MRLVDANLLVYASHKGSPHHAGAKAWLDERLNSTERLGIPWESLTAFVRLVSNPRIFAHAVTVARAWEQAQGWLGRPAVWTPQPTERHAEILDRIQSKTGLQSKHVPDAHLAALAIEHGLILCSTDSDFSRFDGLRWENPLNQRHRTKGQG